MPTDDAPPLRPHNGTGVAIAMLWAVRAVWFATSGHPPGPGVGAGLLAARSGSTVIRRYRAHSTCRHRRYRRACHRRR